MNKFQKILLIVVVFTAIGAYASTTNLENKFTPVVSKVTTMPEVLPMSIEISNNDLSTVAQPVELVSQVLVKPVKKEIGKIEFNIPKVNIVKPVNSVENSSTLFLHKVKIEDRNSLVFQARDTLRRQQEELNIQIASI
ncbi:MAG: hypothetical protein PHG83_01390 [Patescibacteria group bacterium]|nr:hypothetical protein [Patescibacteria group bacterium]